MVIRRFAGKGRRFDYPRQYRRRRGGQSGRRSLTKVQDLLFALHHGRESEGELIYELSLCTHKHFSSSQRKEGRKKLTEEVRGADTTTQLLGGRKRYAGSCRWDLGWAFALLVHYSYKHSSIRDLARSDDRVRAEEEGGEPFVGAQKGEVQTSQTRRRRWRSLVTFATSP